MAIEVVKDKSSIAKETAEDKVLWALNVALDVVKNINNELDDQEVFSSGDTVSIASLLLKEYNNLKN